MNLLDIQTRVKRSFGDESGAQITDDDITRWANDAVLDIVRETKCNQKTTSLPLSVGVISYSIPKSITITSVRVDGQLLRGVGRSELDQMYPDSASTEAGMPSMFAAWDGGANEGTQVDIRPKPDSSVTTLAVVHNTRPNLLANPSDALTIPEEYQDIVFRRCLERAYELDGQWNAADRMNADAKTKTDRARADSTEKMDDSYPSIRVLPGDMGY